MSEKKKFMAKIRPIGAKGKIFNPRVVRATSARAVVRYLSDASKNTKGST